MVFLTSLNILDTGFLDVATRTNQLGASSRANSGSAFQLKGVNFDMVSSCALDKAVTPSFTPTDIKGHEKRGLVSINPTTITLKIYLNADNTDTTNYWGVDDMALLSELQRLPQTSGWKALYYPVDNTATPNEKRRDNQIVYQLGETDTTESQGDINMTLWTGATSAASKDLTDVNYIPVRFESVKITQLIGNKVEIAMQAVVTG